MELRHLRYFTAVARELHFGRAAEALNMAQPPLSQQIQNLEAELGVKLFDRSRRRVSLTEAGEVFLKRARVILDTADQAAVEAQRIGRGEMGRLAVGFMSAAMLDQFPPILSTFREQLPDARVELVQMPSDEQLAGVAGGHIDVGFGDLAETAETVDVNGTRVRIETIWREELLAALPPRHRLANRPTLDLTELAGEPFVTLPRAPATGFYDQVIGLCHAAGFSPQIKQEASQLPGRPGADRLGLRRRADARLRGPAVARHGRLRAARDPAVDRRDAAQPRRRPVARRRILPHHR